MTSEGQNPSEREYANNPPALRKAKIVFNFGLSECKRVEGKESSPIIRRANFSIKIYLPLRRKQNMKMTECISMYVEEEVSWI